jgi:two-component system, NtrC family, sensor kinase
MKPANSPPRGLGITGRTALLSWLASFITLMIFVVVIIPEQKRIFLANLESKAHGVAVSLRDVAAGAAINEDFSSVVDHCKAMLNGDDALAYLVITKNDGFSLLNDRTGWRSETEMGKAWRPDKREPASGIGAVPPFKDEVFYYSQPFDYSGIQWGWIHVGLSLQTYNQSVAMVYRRTGLLAVACILLSLFASVLYARQLVRPILNLRQVVGQVASGNLSARAEISRSDELGSLAVSVNSMTQALLRRDRILESVRFAAQQCLGTADYRSVIDNVLARIGEAANASRAYVFENGLDASGNLLAFQRNEWVATGVSSQLNREVLLGCDYVKQGFARWIDVLGRGEVICGIVGELPPVERPLLREQEIRSIIAIPIRVEDTWWGFLGLDECAYNRVWTDAECHSIRAAADMLGATITRQRAQDALLEAKATLEQRVQERTRELQEQVLAREKAHAALAEAQQRLMDISRAAGMAEVATGVLHNVGNVLNSVSVSANVVTDRFRQSRVANLRRATKMLREHHDNLPQYLTTDPKGRILPEYLCTVADQISAEHSGIITEMKLLNENIEHIKEIVAMQQSYAKVAGAFEHLNPADILEDAIRMNESGLARHHIEIVREFPPDVPRCNVDRHKVLQIIINLMRNAKHALKHSNTVHKCLNVRLENRGDTVAIRIRDNGIGISPENLTQIFRHGFTTKKDGHGFGLHSGANAAKEMGGRLTVHSDGLGYGAEFSLEFPVAHHEAAFIS